jgi:hypothetical protein
MSDHYKSHPSGIEAIEITQYESFLRGNIIKYVMRAPYKGSELEDLQKAQQYLTWEIERIKEEQFWENFDNTVVKDRLAELNEMRSEWDEFKKDSYDYYRAGMTKTFDEVVYPDKCQECSGDCKVC